jgi:3-dehydroquinate synthase
MNILEEEVCCSKTKVFIGKGSLQPALREILGSGRVAVVRQEAVDPTYLLAYVKNVELEVVLKGGEESKNIETVVHIISALYSRGFQRSDYMIALGGGALTDTAGLAAALYLRGLHLVNVPTTLLGMVDASVGGKTAVNFGNMKNVIGVFYQPSVVVADLNFLDTLPLPEYINGLAEVVKYAFTMDAELCEYLHNNAKKVLGRDYAVLEDVVSMSIRDKLSIVKSDPYELKHIRIVLNYGHTIGHAIETLSQLRVSHGRAIAVGMVYESCIGEALGYHKSYVTKKLRELLHLLGLPTRLEDVGISRGVDAEVWKAVIARDKKMREGKLTVPMLTDIGSWKPAEMTVDEFIEVFMKCV